MRQVLFEIPVKGDWHIGSWQVPGFGFGLLLVLWAIVGGVQVYREYKSTGEFTAELKASLLWWAVIAALIVLAPRFIPVDSLSIYGYGAMLVAGVICSGKVAAMRAKMAGIDPQFAWDLAIKLVLAGVVGARLFYVIQYSHRVFKDCNAPLDYLFAAIRLPDGGLVLYGGIILAALYYFIACRVRGVDFIKLADAAMPALFVGVMCGRIGCFLNGCCWGDTCSLPWAISFPEGSLPWGAMVTRGFLEESAARTLPLHPTQLYSAANALVLAILTGVYYRYRAGDGSVIALGLITYPISRFCIEILRGDEMGQLGTGLTISQLVSIGVFLAGLVLAWWSWTRSRPRLPSDVSAETPRAV